MRILIDVMLELLATGHSPLWVLLKEILYAHPLRGDTQGPDDKSYT